MDWKAVASKFPPASAQQLEAVGSAIASELRAEARVQLLGASPKTSDILEGEHSALQFPFDYLGGVSLLLGALLVSASWVLKVPKAPSVLLCAAGCTLLWLSSLSPTVRLVIVSDPDVQDLDERLQDIKEHYAPDDCLFLQRVRDTQAQTEHIQFPWCQIASTTVTTIEEGIRTAARYLEQRSALEMLWDFLRGTEDRVVLLAGDSRLGAVEGHSLQLVDLAERTIRGDIRVDYAESGSGGSSFRAPELEIRTHESNRDGAQEPGSSANSRSISTFARPRPRATSRYVASSEVVAS